VSGVAENKVWRMAKRRGDGSSTVHTHTHTQTYNSTHTHTYIHTRKQAMYMRANAHTNTNTNTHVQALGKFRTRVGTGMAKIFLERVQGYRWLLLICMNIRFQGEYG
jgi:hypothetical protein